MKRGTPALRAASSSNVCESTITSRRPDKAEITQDAPEHALVNAARLLKSTSAIVAPSVRNSSSLPRGLPNRTSAITAAPRWIKALAMRPPRLPVAPARTINLFSITESALEKPDARRHSLAAQKRPLEAPCVQ